MAKTQRKAVTKKTRFEVFKRDKFTCQYCGRMAPDVVLHVDHINPVANGGESDAVNLVTSCSDCNSGKSDRLLSDNATVRLQQAEMLALAERREQLQMMQQWRKELRLLASEMADMIRDEIEHCCNIDGSVFSDKTLSSLCKVETIRFVMDAIACISDKMRSKCKTPEECVLLIKRYAEIEKQDAVSPGAKKAAYIVGIMKNKSGSKAHLGEIKERCTSLIRSGHNADVLVEAAKNTSSVWSFVEMLRGGGCQQ